jgi:hypothetical protein
MKKADAQAWIAEAAKQRATSILVMDDTFDSPSDEGSPEYPVYLKGEDPSTEAGKRHGQNMQHCSGWFDMKSGRFTRHSGRGATRASESFAGLTVPKPRKRRSVNKQARSKKSSSRATRKS